MTFVVIYMIYPGDMSTLRQEDPTPTPTATITPTPTATLTPIYDALLPVGSIQMFGGPTPPDGWLWCDGSEIGREDFPQLFAVYGTYYGAGDGVSTFRLPDCRGRAPVASGAGAGLSNRTLGQVFGAETHILTPYELPAYVAYMDWNPPYGGSGTRYVTTTGTNIMRYIVPASAGQSHNNVQPSIALNFIIWSGVIELSLPGAGGGGDPGPLPTPVPDVYIYSTVEAGGAGQPVAFAYTVDAGQVMISVLLFALLLVMLIQFVFKLRREV